MKIGLVASHAWPIPNPARTGDVWVLDLAIALEALGHKVTMYAPLGTDFHNVKPMRCAMGKYPPSALQCEHACFMTHLEDLLTQDIVHDTSVTKYVGLMMAQRERPVCMTLSGGPWREVLPPVNLFVCSESQRERVLRGATDYDGTRTPEIGGTLGQPVKDARVVPLGIDTGFYCPSDYPKGDYVLWLNRWHPVKGFGLAIEWAKRTKMKLVIAGEHPDNETSDYQSACAVEAQAMCKGLTNIDFRWLPGDPDHHTAKRELYRRAKALLYPAQFQEPFGLSQVEALACGTPVIATRYGSTPEILDHGTTGWLVNDDAGVFDGITEGVKWAAKADPSACRAVAVGQYDRLVMARGYLAQYHAIIDGARW